MNFCNLFRIFVLLPALLQLSCGSSSLLAAEISTVELYQRSMALLAENPAQVIVNFEQTRKVLQQAPAWYQQDWYLLAARAYTARGLYPQARDSLIRADDLVPTGLPAGNIALTAGFVTYHQQYRQSARFWFNCAEKLPNPPESRAKLLLNLGIVEAFSNEYQSAMAHYQNGLALSEQHQFSTLIPMYLNNMGNLYWRLAQYEPAITALRQANFRYAALNNKVSQSRSGINLLNVLVTMEDWARYQRFYPGIVQVVAEVGNQEYELMLSIFEAVRQRTTQQKVTLSDTALKQQMSALRNINLQEMAQLLAAKIQLDWRAPKAPMEPAEQQLRLPNTQALCFG